MQKLIIDLHEAIKNAAERRSDQLTGLAGRVRSVAEVVLGGLKIKRQQSDHKPEAPGVDLEVFLPTQEREGILRKYKAGLYDSILKKLQSAKFTDIGNVADLALEIAGFMNDTTVEQFFSPLSHEMVRGAEGRKSSVIRRIVEIQSGIISTSLEIYWDGFCIGDIDLAEKDVDVNGDAEVIYDDLSAIMRAKLESKLPDNLSAEQVTYLRDLLSNDPKMTDKELVRRLNLKFYAGLGYMPEAVVASHRDRLVAIKPTPDEKPTPGEPSVPPVQMESKPFDVVALSAEHRRIYLKAQQLLACFHEGSGQNIIGPIVVRVLLDSVGLLSEFDEEERAKRDFIFLILSTFTKNLTANRDARLGHDERIVSYASFTPERILDAFVDGLTSLSFTLRPSEAAQTPPQPEPGLNLELIRPHLNALQEAYRHLASNVRERAGIVLKLQEGQNRIETIVCELAELDQKIAEITSQIRTSSQPINFETIAQLSREGQHLSGQREQKANELGQLKKAQEELWKKIVDSGDLNDHLNLVGQSIAGLIEKI